MYNSFSKFDKSSKKLLQYIETILLEKKWLKAASNSSSPQSALQTKLVEKLLDQRIDRQILRYNSIVVSLYGFFEEFIEEMLRRYAGALESCYDSYSELPQKITNAHLGLTLKVLDARELPKYEGVLQPSRVVENLSRCLNGSRSFRLNHEAFAFHTSNFRWQVVDRCFNRLDVDNLSGQVFSTGEFQSYLSDIGQEPEQSSPTKEDALFPINNLAQRRNHVAHGESITHADILSWDILEEYIGCFRAYSVGLLTVLKGAWCRHLATSKGINIGKPIDVYNNEVVCLEVCDTDVEKGNLLIAAPSDNKAIYRGGRILRIEINNKSVERAPARRDGVKIGVQVPFHASANQSFYVVPTEVMEDVMISELRVFAKDG